MGSEHYGTQVSGKGQSDLEEDSRGIVGWNGKKIANQRACIGNYKNSLLDC